MKKKLCIAVIITLLAVLFVGLGIFSVSAETSGYYTYTVSGGEATITDVSTYISGSVTIPSTLGGYPVTRIGASAFYECMGLGSVTIPDSVTSIGSSAFLRCEGLSSIAIPNSVKSIGTYAFGGCTSLVRITIPDSVTSIGSSAFESCTRLTSITVSSGNAVYSSVDGVLFNKGKTKLICYPGGKSTTIYTIPNSVTSIGYNAFYKCTGLKGITIPDGVTSIGEGAFSGCAGLTSVTIGNGVTSIGDDAFYNCDGLTSITIPDSVTSIGDWAFDDCDGLTSVTIGNGVTSIGGYAFDGCSKLTDVWYAGTNRSNISIGSNNSQLTNAAWHYGVEIVGEHVYSGTCDTGCNVCSATRSSSTAHTYNNNCDTACNVCSTMRTAPHTWSGACDTQCNGCTETRPSSTAHTYNNNCDTTCNVCSTMRTITHTYTNNCDISCDVCSATRTAPHTYTNDCDTECNNCSVIRSCSTYTGTQGYFTYRIDPDENGGIVTITKCDTAVEGALSVPSIVKNRPVVAVENNAFAYCSKLTEVTISDSVTRIGKAAFSGCTGLESVTIGNGVTSIGDYAFWGCTALKTVNFNAVNCTAMGRIDFSIECVVSVFDDCTALTTVNIGENVIFVPDYAFYKCSGLTNITIPDSVTSIGKCAFYNCSGLTSVTIGNGVTSIAGAAFYDCSNLKTVWHVGANRSGISIGRENTPLTSATWHYGVEIVDGHTHSSVCDEVCNVCDATRTTLVAHTYTNTCDASCNVCSETRTAPHVWSSACDVKCNKCSTTRTSFVEHTYTNTCDTVCNDCSATRTITHTYTNTCDTTCNVCGKIRSIKHTYSNSSDLTCNVCKSSRTPSAPVASTVLATSVTLKTVSGCEYSMNKTTWQTSPTFSGLTPLKSYTFYQRVKATGSANVSGISAALTVKTKKGYTITYNPNFNNGTVIKSTKTHGVPLTIDGYANRSSYRFVGWSLTPYGEVTYYSGSTYSKDKSLTLYAKWRYSCSWCNGFGTALTTRYENQEKTCTTCSGKGKVTEKDPRIRCINCGSYDYYTTSGGTFGNFTVGAGKWCRECGEPAMPNAWSVEKSCTACYGVGKITTSQLVTVPTRCTMCNNGIGGIAPHPKAPAPVREKVTMNVVELADTGGLEYSKDGYTWQLSPIFNNLSPGTKYAFYQRYKKTKDNSAGEVSEAVYITTRSSHAYKTTTTKATLTANGKKVTKCSVCGKTSSTTTIYRPYSFKLSTTAYTYNGAVKTPSVTVKDAAGKTISSSNYTVTYATGRKNAGTYSVKITMKGNYTGTKTLTFKINPIDISKCSVKLSATSYTYNGAVKTPSVVVKNAGGTTLTKNTHYTVTYASGRKNAGTYTVKVAMKGNYAGTKTLSFKINPISISKCKLSLSTTTYTYDGKTKTPSVVVKSASGTKLTKNTHYTVTYASGRKNVGTYKVTIKMKGNYSGTKTLTFKVNPAKTTVSKVTPATKSLKVSITKKSTQVTGYQVQYSTSKSFKSVKTVNIGSYKTTSTTIKSLKAKTTYYVRVRTYKTVNGTKYYSGWSTVKYAKTK